MENEQWKRKQEEEEEEATTKICSNEKKNMSGYAHKTQTTEKVLEVKN